MLNSLAHSMGHFRRVGQVNYMNYLVSRDPFGRAISSH